MERIHVDGACHCGRVTYEAEVDPARLIICHCTDCQTISGAPYRVNVPAPIDRIRLTGEPKTYTKHGDSGAEVKKMDIYGEIALFPAPAQVPVFAGTSSGKGVRRRGTAGASPSGRR